MASGHAVPGERLRRIGSDPFDAAFEAPQPRCGPCLVVMRDVPGGWRCPSCGRILFAEYQLPAVRRAV